MNARGPQGTLASLEERLVADLHPVRPLKPRRVCLLVLALGLGVGFGVLWPTLGLRGDAGALGALGLWSSTFVTIGMSSVLIVLALRRGVPGNLPSAGALALFPILSIGLNAGIYLLIYRQSPSSPPLQQAASAAWRCFAMELCLGVPFLLLLLLLARRGVTHRPMAPAAVGGLGVALVADAVWRLVCPFSEPAHVVASHGPGITVVVALAVLLAFLWDRSRLKAWRRRAAS